MEGQMKKKGGTHKKSVSEQLTRKTDNKKSPQLKYPTLAHDL